MERLNWVTTTASTYCTVGALHPEAISVAGGARSDSLSASVAVFNFPLHLEFLYMFVCNIEVMSCDCGTNPSVQMNLSNLRDCMSRLRASQFSWLAARFVVEFGAHWKDLYWTPIRSDGAFLFA